MRPSTTARRYAEAAFAVATETGTIDAWTRDLDTAEQVLTAPQVREFFREPKVSLSKKLEVLAGVLPSVRPETLNLLRLLVLRNRVALVGQVRSEFVRLDRQAQGVVEAEVTVARAYSDSERTEMQERLAAATGKHVELHLQVDPRILGGVVVRIGDRLIDGSVSGRLRRLRHEMAV